MRLPQLGPGFMQRHCFDTAFCDVPDVNTVCVDSPVILIIVTVISAKTWLCIICVGLAYDVSLSQMIDNKVDSHFKGLINHYY